MTPASRPWVAVAVALAIGCGRDAPPAPRPGEERAPCKAGTCATGLVCLSDRCVRPPGADCRLVGEALTSLELGNYAPVDERAPKVSAYRSKCEAQDLTAEEGACVIAATTMEQLRACPKPVMFPPYKPTAPGEMIKGLPVECSQYLLTLERYTTCSGIPIEARRSIALWMSSVWASCFMNWPRPFHRLPAVVTSTQSTHCKVPSSTYRAV